MSKITNFKYFKEVLLTILFIVGSFFTYQGVFLALPFITNYGRGLFTYLPTFLLMGVPLFSFIIFYLYYHVYNYQTKWQLIHIYAISLIIIMSYSLIDQILVNSLLIGWDKVFGVITPLFPFDVLFGQVVALGIGIISLYWCHRHKSYKSITKTSDIIVRKRHYVAFIFMAAFAMYFLGDFMTLFTYFNEPIDTNWWGMIPFLLEMLLLPLLVFVYVLYEHKDEKDKTKFQLKAIIIVGSISLLIGLYMLIVSIINPYIVQDSLGGFYCIGYAIKIPFGIFIIIVGDLLVLSLSVVNLVKKFHKNEQK